MNNNESSVRKHSPSVSYVEGGWLARDRKEDSSDKEFFVGAFLLGAALSTIPALFSWIDISIHQVFIQMQEDMGLSPLMEQIMQTSR